MPSVLCVFGHPDDESFGVAGTIGRYRPQGVDFHLLTFTRGDQGTRPEPLETEDDLALLREYELRAAVRVLGIESLELLDYKDGTLDRADVSELAGHVQRSLDATGADTIITFGPEGITHHVDHIGAHRAATLAASRTGRPLRVFYPAVEGEPVEQLKLTGPEAQPTHRIDITDHFDTKLAALACHSSQQDAREFFLRLAKRRRLEELFHRAVPPVEPGRTYDDLFAEEDER